MTDDRMGLLELMERAADAGLAGEMPACAAERIRNAGLEMLTGAAKGARSALRATHRTGDRERTWNSPAARIDLAIPNVSRASS